MKRTSEEKRAKALELQAEKLTQQEIADRLGVNQRTVSRIERAAGKPRRRSFADQATGFEK